MPTTETMDRDIDSWTRQLHDSGEVHFDYHHPGPAVPIIVGLLTACGPISWTIERWPPTGNVVDWLLTAFLAVVAAGLLGYGFR